MELTTLEVGAVALAAMFTGVLVTLLLHQVWARREGRTASLASAVPHGALGRETDDEVLQLRGIVLSLTRQLAACEESVLALQAAHDATEADLRARPDRLP